MNSALQQAQRAFLNSANKVKQGVVNFGLDFPFYSASFQQSLLSKLLPNIPFNKDNWTRKDYPPTQEVIDNLEYTPVKSDSGELRPYLVPPQSDVPQSVLANILTNAGFRPAAVNYLSKLPILIGDQYLPNLGEDRRVLGVAEKQPAGFGPGEPNLPYFIGMSPNMDDQQQYNDVVTHELLHEAPRLRGYDVRTKRGTQNLNRLMPLTDQVKAAMTDRWGPEYMAARPAGLQEEAFAERMLPQIFYKHLLNQ